MSKEKEAINLLKKHAWNLKFVSNEASNDIYKAIELLESVLADKSELEQKLPLCLICGKPQKVIAVFYEVHFDCRPKEGD